MIQAEGKDSDLLFSYFSPPITETDLRVVPQICFTVRKHRSSFLIVFLNEDHYNGGHG